MVAVTSRRLSPASSPLPPTAFARAAVFLATPGCAPPSPRRPRHPCRDGNGGARSLVHRFTQARRGTRSCCASVPATSCAADRSEQEASVRSGAASAGKFAVAAVIIVGKRRHLSSLSFLSSPSSSSSLHRVALHSPLHLHMVPTTPCFLYPRLPNTYALTSGANIRRER